MSERIVDSNNFIKHNRTNPMLSKTFSFFMAWYPLLCVYKAFYRFTIGDILLIAYVFFAVVNTSTARISGKKISPFLPFIFYAVFITFFSLLVSSDASSFSVLFRLIKMIFYLFSVVFVSQNFLDFETFKKWIIRSTLVSAVIVYIQYISYYVFNSIFLAKFTFLELYLDEYSALDYERIYNYQFRPTSLYVEPATACQFMAVGLVIILFNKNFLRLKKLVYTAIVISGMLMTTSGQGVLFIVLAVALYFLYTYKNSIKIIGYVLFAIILGLILYNSVPVIKNAADRLLFNENAADARLGSVEILNTLTAGKLFFGCGYGNVPEDYYMASAVYITYGCGIIGFLLALRMFYRSYRLAPSSQSKIICIEFFAMFFGASLFLNYMLFWYFSLIMFLNDKQGNVEFYEDPLYPRRL